MDWIKSVKTIYSKGKRFILYFDLIFVVIVFYAGKYLGDLRDVLLPGAIAGAFAILLETLFSMNAALQEKEEMHIYNHINLAYPKIMEIIRKGGSSKHSIKIIAASGGTTINAVIPQILAESTVPVSIELMIIDTNPSLRKVIPLHWPSESHATLEHIKKIGSQEKQKCEITCYLYNYIPCVRGYLIDGKHLIIGYFVWGKNDEQTDLIGASSTHIYYQRQPKYEHYFKLFESWFNYSPKKAVYTNIVKPS